ncbi:MAG: D-2-hydroxyacid dehydrogenase [bacterium]|nr:D-2-hydroxyacid dehydrogenase [bacterium]
MDQIKVVMMAGYFTNWIDQLSAVSPRVQAIAAHTPEDLKREIVDAEVIYGRLPLEPFLEAKKLRWVQSIGVGFETMLYPEMINSDVIITNTAGAFDTALAEHALALILSFTRGTAFHDRKRKNREWNRNAYPASLIHGKTACVLGLGTIGKSIARTLNAMGMHVLGIDAQIKEAPQGVRQLIRPDSMYTALSEADIVVVALPLTDGTRGIVNADCFNRMKNTALIVNIARGPIINETDLIEALRNEKIAGAALDVFEQEPPAEDNPLWDMPNVVLTPHIASLSAEGDENLQKIFVENLRRYVAGEPLLNIVDKKKGYVVQKA